MTSRGLDPYDPDVITCDRPRSKAQRLHDALLLILKQTVDTGVLGSRGKQPVHIGVTISNAAPGALPARTGSGHTVPAGLVRRWLCDSAITRFVLGAGGSRADPTGHVLIPHHVTPYADCGTTSLADTVLLCEYSHADLHIGGKILSLKDGRRLNESGWVQHQRR